ncbi:MAG: hypothetical protein IPO86_02795 [Saprospiraceae bacterium]|nr:hypothetical protein [Saprospiraceae bacterium]
MTTVQTLTDNTKTNFSGLKLDNNRHRFERQPQKKLKKIPAHKKFYATHIAHICLCLLSHNADPKAKSKECNRQRFNRFVESVSVILKEIKQKKKLKDGALPHLLVCC